MHAKNQGASRRGRFLVPRLGDEMSSCPAKHVRYYQTVLFACPRFGMCYVAFQLERYLVDLRKSLGADVTGRLFQTVKKNGGYASTPLGRNMLAGKGKEIANLLGLENPNKYTTHTWRRSSATLMANEGATREDMRGHFAWASEDMASV